MTTETVDDEEYKYDEGDVRIVKCRIEGELWWLALLRKGRTFAVLQRFDGSEVRLRMVPHRDLHTYSNACAMEDTR